MQIKGQMFANSVSASVLLLVTEVTDEEKLVPPCLRPLQMLTFTFGGTHDISGMDWGRGGRLIISHFQLMAAWVPRSSKVGQNK